MGQVSQERLRKLKQHSDKGVARKRQTVKQPTAKPQLQQPHTKLQTERRKLASIRPADSKTNSQLKPKEQKRLKPKVYPNWHWAWTHPYLMTAFAFGIASNVAVLHVADLLFSWPFHGACLLYDSVAALSGFVLAAMCVHTYRDLPKYGHGSISLEV